MDIIVGRSYLFNGEEVTVTKVTELTVFYTINSVCSEYRRLTTFKATATLIDEPTPKGDAVLVVGAAPSGDQIGPSELVEMEDERVRISTIIGGSEYIVTIPRRCGKNTAQINAYARIKNKLRRQMRYGSRTVKVIARRIMECMEAGQ